MKYIINIVFCIFFSTRLFSIDIEAKPKIKIGAKVYYDRSGNTSISQLKADMINYGIDIQIPIVKHFNIQTGVYKITKAVVFTLDPNYFNNINIPLGVVYENNFFYLMSGGYYEKTIGYVPEEYPTNYTDEIKNYNYGLYFGLGIEKMILKNFSITADMREMWNINNYDRPYAVGTNKTIGFSFGLQYKL